MKKKSAFHSVRRNLREDGFFKLRVLFGVLLCFVGVTIVLFALGKASAQPRTPVVQTKMLMGGLAAANKIAPWVMEHTANGQEAEFFVVLADQADLSAADTLSTKAEKGRFVYQTLQSKAQTTQDSILQWLRDRASNPSSFYIVNAILVKGTMQVAEALAARPDVARVEGNPLIHNDLPQPGPSSKSSSRVPPANNRPGITYTHAPQVWALGFTGQNIVIASADTGQRWTHNALNLTIAAGTEPRPITITIGMIPSTTAVAILAVTIRRFLATISSMVITPRGQPWRRWHGQPDRDGAGRKWIGCRNMDEGNGTPTDTWSAWSSSSRPIRSTGGRGDPTKAPDITINSWGCPASEGCSFDTLQAAVEAQAAAGIQMVVAAGNSGSACSTVTDPPSLYAASYTVGALNTGTDTIASFSSRGPVTVDGSNRIKPDIAAPGTGTRSASNTADNAYTTASGTSMATPHIAGAMGLLWSALPSLATPNHRQSRCFE